MGTGDLDEFGGRQGGVPHPLGGAGLSVIVSLSLGASEIFTQ